MKSVVVKILAHQALWLSKVEGPESAFYTKLDNHGFKNVVVKVNKQFLINLVFFSSLLQSL